MNAGSRADHNKFCLIEKWTLLLDARGRGVGHHVTYELALDDGRILRTRVSRPVDTTTYGPGLWKAILRDQLDVTEGQFWACVQDKQVPDRGQASVETTVRAMPAGLLYQLIHIAHVPENQAKTLTLEQALAIMTAHWSKPQTP